MLDFARTSKDINSLFEDLSSLDFFFLQLQQLTGVRLYEQESVIIFDEVQLLPKARQAGNAMHRSLMRIFRLYMLVGGMPQAVETYVADNNLQSVDEAKREIVDLYEEDFTKIDGTGLAGDVYDAIIASLSGNASRYVLANARAGIKSEQMKELVPDMLSSYTVLIAYHANNPSVGMSLEKDAGRY